MSISLYYSARRGRALSPSEQQSVAALIEADDDRDVVAAGGEPFGIYPCDALGGGVVFEGSVKLPDSPDPELAWAAIQHWAGLVSAIRRVIPGASWSFRLDDREFAWDSARQEYDPAAETP